MSEEIRPALSAEEWQRGMSFDGRAGLRWDGRAVLHYWGNTGAWVEIDPSDAHAIVALANASLPDGDPRKITQDDVLSIHEAGKREIIGAQYGEQGANEAWGEELVGIAAKLAALLPPTPPPRAE